VSQRVHHQKRCVPGNVSKIIFRGPFVRVGQEVGSTAINLMFLCAPLSFPLRNGKAMPAKLLPPPWHRSRYRESLPPSPSASALLPDDGLVQNDMVKYTAQRVFGVLALDGILDASEMASPRLPGDDGFSARAVASRFGQVRRTGDNIAAVCLYHDAPVRLLIIADPHHVNHAFKPISLQAHASALPIGRRPSRWQGALRLPFIHIGLHKRGIQLMAADWADMFRFVVNPGRCIEHFLQGPGAKDRTWPIQAIYIPDFIRDSIMRSCDASCMIKPIGKSEPTYPA